MKKELEILSDGIKKMEIVTVASACEQTGLSRKEILAFISTQPQLRIFDEEKSLWINENVDGHC